MAGISGINNYISYSTNSPYSYLFGGTQTSSTSGTYSLSDYASIKNGSYKKLLKAYYKEQNEEKITSSDDSTKKTTIMKSEADTLKKSADALNNAALWEKKKMKQTNEETGETTEVEDYDWKAITKAVKSFVDDYNGVIEQAGNSNLNDVLRNGVWMVGNTKANENILSKIGIKVSKENKLELDEDKLKEADISTLKVIFTGHNSFANKVSTKANSISNAATRAISTYNKNGKYSNLWSELVSSKVDEEG